MTSFNTHTNIIDETSSSTKKKLKKVKRPEGKIAGSVKTKSQSLRGQISTEDESGTSSKKRKSVTKKMKKNYVLDTEGSFFCGPVSTTPSEKEKKSLDKPTLSV